MFSEILNEVCSMFKHSGDNSSLEGMLKNFTRLNHKYQLLTTDDKLISSAAAEQERNHNKKQVRQVSKKTKAFSESALAFSEQLALIIEEKLKFEKRVGRLK